MPPKKTTTPMTDDVIKQFIAQGVADALAEYEANKGSGNGDDNHDSRTCERRQVPTTRECTYIDFLKCQPFNFKGTEGVVGLTQWLEKIEYVFHISNCTVGHSTWQCSDVRRDQEAVNQNMDLRSWGTDVCATHKCSKNWALKVRERMFSKETDQVEKYVGVLPDMIQESMMASRPKTMLEAIEIANDLMDQKITTFVERQAENKRKLDNNNNLPRSKVWP
ncbi:hypothetical protein Tco_0956792 [Tanacetum coccineum]